MSLIHIAGKSYELVLENKNGFNLEAFRNRYSEVLERYDYIVGDWGYNQLRLKGFFRDGHAKATKDTTLSYASDYINEYCNFGCAYFVLEKKIDTNPEQDQPEVDPLLEDLDEEIFVQVDYDKKVQTQQKEAKQEQVRKKPDKAKQQEKQDGVEKYFDKFANKPFKPKQKNQEQKANKPNPQQEDSTTAKPENRNKKRKSNRSFRHMDKKKANKEQVTVTATQE